MEGEERLFKREKLFSLSHSSPNSLLEGEEILFKKEKLFSLRGELELELSLTRAPSKRLTAVLVPRFP